MPGILSCTRVFDWKMSYIFLCICEQSWLLHVMAAGNVAHIRSGADEVMRWHADGCAMVPGVTYSAAVLLSLQVGCERAL